MKPSRMLVSTLLALACSVAYAQSTKLKFAIFTPDREQTFVTVFKPFADAVNKEAAGSIEIELFPNGALGRNPLQQAQMVLDGVADIGWVVPSYTAGRFPDNDVLELPGLFRDLREATNVATRLVLAGKLKSYNDFFPIGVVGTEPYSLHARTPINSIADIRGKKIRTSSSIEGEMLKALGAVPVGMPVTEVTEAISRGTIDGATSHPSVLFDFGIVRVTSSDYFVRLGSLPVAVLMNKNKFASLPKAGQDAIRKYSGKWIAERWNEGIGSYNDSLVKKLRADPKRKVVFPSQADLNSMQPAFKAVIGAWAAKSPHNKELLGIVEAEIAAVRAGK